MNEVANAHSARRASPFSRRAVLAIVLVGFAAFLAMLYFISAGDTGGERSGAAHASANGLNGYSGLARLLDAEGFDIERSSNREGLQTSNLLILTPPRNADLEEFVEVLEDRQFYGPTLVIMPKWIAGEPIFEVSEEDQLRMRDDWVQLFQPMPIPWTENLPERFAFEYGLTDDTNWEGLNRSGTMPAQQVIFAEPRDGHDILVSNTAGKALAVSIAQPAVYDDAYPVVFIVEPDLVNNFGLADGQRAGLALDLVREVSLFEGQSVTFDMTLHGFGQTMNLLTLAFRPPFLAATLCLLLAMAIIGWRAFLRFGPTAASGRAIAFGKTQLVSNGAGLIVRARRLGLLADPYVRLIERRVSRALGLAHPDAESIDAALAQRMPEQEPFSRLAARLHEARRPTEILRAAQALNALSTKLTGKPTQ